MSLMLKLIERVIITRNKLGSSGTRGIINIETTVLIDRGGRKEEEDLSYPLNNISLIFEIHSGGGDKGNRLKRPSRIYTHSGMLNNGCRGNLEGQSPCHTFKRDLACSWHEHVYHISLTSSIVQQSILIPLGRHWVDFE